ncbi:MAG: S26 family signal peptidase [Alphaproteobacteria bacterium]|nr:S26 family signal peptidase [Alphaproteobacteria bacterium]
MTASRPIFARRDGRARRRRIGLAVMAALAALWLAVASRVHVNASWSDEAWGYAAFPLFGAELRIGDRVLFEPPDALDSRAWPPGSGAGAGSPRSGLPYLKTVRGLPGMTVAVGDDGTVFLDGVAVGRAKTHALDGRPLAAIAPGIIPPGHHFLHADHPDSHDSRYAEIGLVPRARILGRAVALPDLPWIGLKGPLVGPEDIQPGDAAEARR